MPWYCGQPYGKPLDLALSEEEIKRATIDAMIDAASKSLSAAVAPPTLPS